MSGKESDDSQDHRAFGRALRTLRVRAGLTQEELSERVGIGVAYLSTSIRSLTRPEPISAK